MDIPGDIQLHKMANVSAAATEALTLRTLKAHLDCVEAKTLYALQAIFPVCGMDAVVVEAAVLATKPLNRFAGSGLCSSRQDCT